jgi:hypothetical protein
MRVTVAFHDRLGIGPDVPLIDVLDMMEAMGVTSWLAVGGSERTARDDRPSEEE